MKLINDKCPNFTQKCQIFVGALFVDVLPLLITYLDSYVCPKVKQTQHICLVYIIIWTNTLVSVAVMMMQYSTVREVQNIVKNVKLNFSGFFDIVWISCKIWSTKKLDFEVIVCIVNLAAFTPTKDIFYKIFSYFHFYRRIFYLDVWFWIE